MYKYIGLTLLGFCLGCAAKRPIGVFKGQTTPPAPDYAQLSAWAAHPLKKDLADSVPRGSGLTDNQTAAKAAVFFIHPTSYTHKRGHDTWNGDVQDARLNKATDEGSILYQASIFNGVGQVYAPRYRQAHIEAFFTKDVASAKAALDLAYTDVKAAFEHFLATIPADMPIIIAAHSQGTHHARQLLKTFFDGKPLQKRLVVAYIVGLPVLKNAFSTLQVCEKPEDIGCFCSWRTFKTGYEPRRVFPMSDEIVVVNPLSMTTEKGIVGPEKHDKMVLLGFKTLEGRALSAEIHKGLLWVTKPRFKGSVFYRSPNYHIADYNFFYFNIRNDVAQRLQRFLAQP